MNSGNKNSACLLIVFPKAKTDKSRFPAEGEGGSLSHVLIPLGDCAPMSWGSLRPEARLSMPPSLEWDLAIRQSTRAAAELLSDAFSVPEMAVAGLVNGLSELGVRGVVIPGDAASWMDRSLSYRVQTEAWERLHELDEETQVSLTYAMASALHDGRVLHQSKDYLGTGFEHLLLPVELAGEDAFSHDAAILMKYLQCLGLDRGLGHPNEYGRLFSCESREGAEASPSFAPLMDKYRVERRKFVKTLGVSSLTDIADYVVSYGRSSELLGKRASKVLQNRKTAHRIACRVIQQGPDPDLSNW